MELSLFYQISLFNNLVFYILLLLLLLLFYGTRNTVTCCSSRRPFSLASLSTFQQSFVPSSIIRGWYGPIYGRSAKELSYTPSQE
jgi:hypothetical protein